MNRSVPGIIFLTQQDATWIRIEVRLKRMTRPRKWTRAIGVMQLLLVCVVFEPLVAFLMLGCSPREPTTPSGASVYSFTWQQLCHEFEKAGYGNVDSLSVRRTDDAAGLIMSTRWKTGGSAWIVRKNIWHRIDCPHGRPYVDEEGKIIAWTTSNGVVFADGDRLAVEISKQYVSLEPSGKYFLVMECGSGSWNSWIGQIGRIKERIWTCDGVACTGLRRIRNKLFVFGIEPSGLPICFLLDETESRVVLERTVHLRGGDIVDVDPSGECLLLERNGVPFSSLSVYNIQSGVETKSSKMPEYCSVFLREDPFAQTNKSAVSDKVQ